MAIHNTLEDVHASIRHAGALATGRKVIRKNAKAKMAGLVIQPVQQQYSNPLLSGIMAGMEGIGTGLQISSGLSSLMPEGTGGYVLTRVPADFWEQWLATHADFPMIEDGTILGPHKDAAGQARGHIEVPKMHAPTRGEVKELEDAKFNPKD